MDNAKRHFKETMSSLTKLAATPVDVAATSDDTTLDDHVWMRVSRVVDEGGLDAVRAMSADVRAYYVTLHFEREVASGGPTGFLEFGGRDLAPFVAEGYRRLGSIQAAEAFEDLWRSGSMNALLVDIDSETPEGSEELGRLIQAVGTHDRARMAFVRAHPESFSG